MKSDGLLKMLLIAFVIALVVYAVAFFGIQNRRTRRGPWQVAFTNDVSGAPELIISQPALAITNVQIIFPNATLPKNFSPKNLAFDQPREVPFDLPFGQCLFMDPTFLPGTLVFSISGHEIQLIPRVLTIDKVEQPWKSNATISLSPAVKSESRGSKSETKKTSGIPLPSN
jgi:hypothetical protein